MSRPLPHFPKPHAHTVFTLLHHCISARPGYLARVVESDVSQVALRSFDVAVDSSLVGIIGADVLKC